MSVLRPSYVLRGIGSNATSIADCAGLHIVGTADGRVTLWSKTTRRVVWETALSGSNGVSSVAILSKTSEVVTIAAFGRDGTVFVVKVTLADAGYQGHIKGHSLGTCSLANASFSPLLPETPSLSLVPGPEPEHVTVLRVQTDTQGEVGMMAQGVMQIDESLDKHGMVTATLCQQPIAWVGYENGSVCAWDTTNDEPTLQLDMPVLSEAVCALAFSADHIFIGGACDKLVSLITETVDGTVTAAKAAEASLPKRGINAIAVRPDAKVVAIGCWDHTIRLFKSKKLKALAVLTCHHDAIHAVLYDDHARLVAAGKDGRISVWDV
eukprot:m.43321 g.43321  ORF g.43321 m.43321 type:complete len:323 (-) comp12917_c0_seq1:62-1030(-)